MVFVDKGCLSKDILQKSRLVTELEVLPCQLKRLAQRVVLALMSVEQAARKAVTALQIIALVKCKYHCVALLFVAAPAGAGCLHACGR